MTSADLVGRFLLKGGETVWVDGPLTRAVREGAICYLDEVVEARQDTTVVIHPLADHRRELSIDRLGATLTAAQGFQLVISYNPGYQSVLKNIKESTRQRFVAIELDFPPVEIETEIVAHEAGIAVETARALVKLGNAIRSLDGSPLREVASTRLLILAGGLVAEGLTLRTAVQAAIVRALSDDREIVRALGELADAVLPRRDRIGVAAARHLCCGSVCGRCRGTAWRCRAHQRPSDLRIGGPLRRRVAPRNVGAERAARRGKSKPATGKGVADSSFGGAALPRA